MKILTSLGGLGEVRGPSCVAIGVFDGVHLGHQALIRRCIDEARKVGGSAVALTFHPHPAQILRPGSAPHLLTATAHKEKLIADLGCPNLLRLTFDAKFASQPPETFIAAMVRSANSLRLICVGHNWAFGRNRSGNVDLLRNLGLRLGFETLEIEPVIAEGDLVSSTRIRQSIESGNFETARRLLGREYSILGTVRHGAGLGREIGFPTANLAAHNEQFPPDGVYSVHVLVRGNWLKGVANIGVRPTVEQRAERRLEVHIFDFHADCYGEDLEVRFVRLLRTERKFASLDELKAQITRDAQEAARTLV